MVFTLNVLGNVSISTNKTTININEIVNEIVRYSLLYTPVDTGYLFDSLYVYKHGMAFEIGYKAEYAAYVHECSNYHIRPAKRKFLEDATVEVLSRYFVETGIVVPAYIIYSPLRVIVGSSMSSGKKIFGI